MLRLGSLLPLLRFSSSLARTALDSVLSAEVRPPPPWLREQRPWLPCRGSAIAGQGLARSRGRSRARLPNTVTGTVTGTGTPRAGSWAYPGLGAMLAGVGPTPGTAGGRGSLLRGVWALRGEGPGYGGGKWERRSNGPSAAPPSGLRREASHALRKAGAALEETRHSEEDPCPPPPPQDLCLLTLAQGCLSHNWCA